MTRVYRWAFDRPARRIFYNLAVTSVSVVVAFLVAAVVLGGLAAGLFDIRTGPVAWAASLDLEHLGFVVAGIFVASWLGAVAIWKLVRFDTHPGLPGTP
jgi:high-affinity nickel-transport protein